jgi:hypothetical protein
MWCRVDLVWTDVSEEGILPLQGRKIRELETSVSTWLQTDSNYVISFRYNLKALHRLYFVIAASARICA